MSRTPEQQDKLPVFVCMCVRPASYVGSNAFLSFKFDYFGEHFSISPIIVALNIFPCTEIRLCANIFMGIRDTSADSDI